MDDQVLMELEPAYPGQRRVIAGCTFSPENGYRAYVDRDAVEELLTYPGETFRLVDTPVAEVLPEYAEPPVDSDDEAHLAVLDGPATDVIKRIGDLHDYEALTDLLEAEAQGKRRVTVMRAIQEQLAPMDDTAGSVIWED